MSNIINKIRLSGTDYTISATTSGGITSGEVQTMINESISGKQDTLSAGTGISIVDNVISATGGGGGGTSAVEVTQAQYDALVSGGTVDPTVFYIITDAAPAEMSQYWTSAQTNSAINASVSGKVDTSTFNAYSGDVETALSNKQQTLTAGTGIDITDNVISVTGGSGGGITSGEVQTMIDESVSGKQDTLSAGTGISIVDNVISATGGGGGGTIDPSLDSGSTNAVANSAITSVLSNYYYATKFNKSQYSSPYGTTSRDGCKGFTLNFSNIANPNENVYMPIWLSQINDREIFYPYTSPPNADAFNFNLVETSAITTTITSSSTDAQVPSAKAVYDTIGNINTVLESI